MKMATSYYVVLTKAVPGREEEFHEWYDAQHLPDCVKVPGVTSARRFRIVSAFAPGAVQTEPEYTSLALYELETDDPAAVARELSARAGSEAMPMTDAFQRGGAMMMVVEPAGECVAAERAP
jgi:hypothetical protein